MAFKKVTKQESSPTNVAKLPANLNEIFRLKVDKETQKFFIDGNDQYGKFNEFILRPLDVLNKLVSYNDDFEVKAESTLHHDLKEATDTWGNASTDKGGKLCGRVVWKKATKGWDADQIAENKAKAKFYTYLFGIATIGKNEPIIIDFRVGGAKFMEVTELLNKLSEDKQDFSNAEIKVTASPNKNPDFDWPEIKFMADFTRQLPIEGLSDVIETIEAYVEDHNGKIREKAEKFKAWKANSSSGGSTYKKNTSFKKKL